MQQVVRTLCAINESIERKASANKAPTQPEAADLKILEHEVIARIEALHRGEAA